MHFDALTLACVAHELNETLTGGRVQQALLVDADSVGLEIYADRQRRYLLLSASRTASRVHLNSQKLRRGADVHSPLLLLLRKRVRGGILTAVRQPDPAERVLRLAFEHPAHGSVTLVAEPMGRNANLLLLGPDDAILAVMHPRGGQTARPLTPGRPYAPPPPMDKLPPLDDGREDYYERLAAVTRSDGKLWRALIDHVAGVSPTQARELAWRAAGDANAPASAANPLALVQALQSLWTPVRDGGWMPGLAVEGGEIAAFAPYEIHFRGRFEPTPTMSAALERYYAGRSEQTTADAAAPDAYAALRAAIANQLKQARRRLQRRLDSLAADEPQPGEPERLRQQAEWLLALSSQIGPDQSELIVDLGEETLHIPLDPHRTPVEQAQRLFKRAAKLERAAVFIPKRRAELEADLAFLDQLAADLTLAENQPEMEAVREELARMGLLAKSKRKPGKKGGRQTATPRRFESQAGFEILVGRNARQNEQVTFHLARAEDLWLHVRDAPGSHVVIRGRGREPDDATIQTAAQLAAYYSSLRGETAAPVAVTQRRFVRRLPGGHTGQVTIRNERTVTVPARLPEGEIED
jgi:predicted ribosome quality control (RQC) complex YloA/Tae2 family protein